MFERDNNGILKIKTFFVRESLLIIAGVAIRVIMIIYYYFSHLDPNVSWGDVSVNFHTTDSMFTGEWIWEATELEYPPLTLYLLLIVKFISFNSIEVFAFYAFLLDLVVSLSFYFILKRFDVPKRNLALGLFLINPFLFLNNVFSPINCGYHITDSFFYIFLILSLFYYPNENKSFFYLFSGLTMCSKWFTLPAAPYFFLKYLFEKNWGEIKKLSIFLGMPLIIFLISPILYLPNYLDLYINWVTGVNTTSFEGLPTIIKLIPISLIFILYLLFRLKKADLLEITFFSIIVMFSIMFWSRFYVRYFTPLILYGHLKTNNNICKIDINLKITRIYFKVGNHLFTLALSVLGCIAAIAIILFYF